jgi:3-oxoacyl-[acyl-carrier protein] reductase
MDLGIEDTVALVTGASRGLGFASAAALAAEGARVAICSRSEENLDKAAARIEAETGNRPFCTAADLTSADDIDAMVARTANALGPPLILVNNTGGPPPGSFDDIDDAAWERAFRLTALSTIRAVRAVVPHMKAARYGRIVNIQSRSVKEPIDGLLTSNAVRPGVVGLAKSLSRELGPEGITVNCVLPGYIRTERLRELAVNKGEREGRSVDEVFAGWGAENPVGRIGSPEEVGALVAFLASKRASFINGQSILVDGGGVRSLF